MIRPNLGWRSVAVLSAACLALAACGDNSGDEPSANATTGGAAGDGVLKIGTILPQTGSLAFLGPPEFAGVDVAIKEINDNGGVLGKPVSIQHMDSGDTSTDIATQSVNKLLTDKVDVIIGAASSSVSLSVIDKITGAGVVQISPANTSTAFTTYNDKGLYFRTAPPDTLQGRVLGDLIVQDGNAKVGMLVLNDSYGVGLAENAKKEIESGGGQVVKSITYDPKAADFTTEVSDIAAANPDAIAIIGFDESKKIVPKLIEKGLKSKKWYFVDGNIADYSKDFAPGTLTGYKGTQPGAETKADFKTRLLAANKDLKDFNYAVESYDATILAALAAEEAKSDNPAEIAKHLITVSKDGEKCTTYKQCVDLIKAGKNIDYDGLSGPISFNDAGDPAEATIGVYTYDANNKLTSDVKYQTGKI
ncbi:ABC transporter substrate-binding protein [Dactylosporangium sucinum]|uniref:Amino acid ABC transporter substrate-binding protein n=1 Tax=Dactylosporangium sucinum TaxID=1424081 RepID=A0A917U5R3_9ACTN|nr:ABC transporter substrate-binding protein [Dactylosporangium sucinum]GGM59947.1 amino acid ABC transporter substrate-binding protein [Dactylosporangium sucinum]